jgi:protein-S-isoprenylcysteine O-methyltransferase Ste14
LSWAAAWAYLLIGFSSSLISTPVLLRKNPSVIAERAQIKEDTKGFDKIFGLCAAILGIGLLAVAGLDQRFMWTSVLPPSIQIFGAVLLAFGYSIFFWALIANKFFSRSVRIQDDRNHMVVQDGPYKFVRHPGYTGMILTILATPMLLASLWAIIPALLSIIAYVFRTSLEDRTLIEELSGYRDYAARVTHRLVPIIW